MLDRPRGLFQDMCLLDDLRFPPIADIRVPAKSVEMDLPRIRAARQRRDWLPEF